MSTPPNPRRGEIWDICFDPSVGAEIQKTRPAVVVNIESVGRLPLREATTLGRQCSWIRKHMEGNDTFFTNAPGSLFARFRGYSRVILSSSNLRPKNRGFPIRRRNLKKSQLYC